MTDNEIIKALECCVSYEYTCLNCPYCEDKHYTEENGFELMPNGKYYDDLSCDEWLKRDVFALVNRQKEMLKKSERVEHFADKAIATLQAENEKLRAEADQIAEDYSNLVIEKDELFDEAEKLIKKARAEAVKEFAENLETALSDHFGGGFYKCHCRHVIDNLLKEKVGD